MLSDKVETLAGLRETPLQDEDVRHAIAYGIRNGSTTGENLAFDMATSSTMSPDRFLDFLYNPEGDK